MSGVHDVAGQPGGPIDRHEHETTLWEQRIDAMMTLLSARGLLDTAELRRGIESLPADAYERMGYYERWAASMATILTEKGIVDADALAARTAALEAESKGREP